MSECIRYMKALPLVDDRCEWKYSGSKFVLMGHSYSCKYLHMWMTKDRPQLHCFHSGRGGRDITGKMKCSWFDCMDKENTTQYETLTNELITKTGHFENIRHHPDFKLDGKIVGNNWI